MTGILRVGQGESRNIPYLNESTIKVAGSTLVSNLSVLPNELFPQMLTSFEKDGKKTIVVTKYLFILCTFQMPPFPLWPGQYSECPSLRPPAHI